LRTAGRRTCPGFPNGASLFLIPTESLAGLILAHGKNHSTERTVKAANAALWRFGVFEQHINFNERHLSEISDVRLSLERRQAIAEAAFSTSATLHSQLVGDTGFYVELNEALANNVDAFGPWWRSLFWRPPERTSGRHGSRRCYADRVVVRPCSSIERVWRVSGPPAPIPNQRPRRPFVTTVAVVFAWDSIRYPCSTFLFSVSESRCLR
jgi:hypothetical protein